MSTKTGVELISDERSRQQSAEGFDSKHDDYHKYNELAHAAAVYALPAEMRALIFQDPYGQGPTSFFKALWPWEMKWWKPTPEDRVRELVKAGALLASEIDRINRNNDRQNSPTLPA